jgi:hypothetical protein
MRPLTPLIIVTLAGSTACERAKQPAPLASEPSKEAPADADSMQEKAPQGLESEMASLQIPGIIACRPDAQVGSTISRAIALADGNADGQVSRDEAMGFANFLVGGFMFRADENSDGSVTPAEGRKAREEFVAQHPALATLLQEAREATGKNSFATLAKLLNIDTTEAVSAASARDLGRRSVDDLFAAVDSNRNGLITPDETKEASWEGARKLGQAAFRRVRRRGLLSRQSGRRVCSERYGPDEQIRSDAERSNV